MSFSKNEFIEFLLGARVLKFGEFTTKSGRQTPYFINTGAFETGAQLAMLGKYYAKAVADVFPGMTNLYGPAYKGIPLAAVTSAALSEKHNIDVSFTFNRKEAKTHGEGGTLIGCQYNNPEKVLIIEDVITAGTAVKETLEVLKSLPNAQIQGLVISVNRMEKVDSGLSAVQEIEQNYGIKTHALVTILDILEFVKDPAMRQKFDIPENAEEKILAYRALYGV
jgi:orotate phosphoribosyltransferase